jgi:transcriptional regulator with XRE-family HTH domain
MEWRKKKGLTQQQLADRLPIGEDGKPTGKDQISRWENSKRGMTMEVQVALAEALNLDTPGDLFRDPNMPSADDLLRRANPEQRIRILAVIETMLKTG